MRCIKHLTTTKILRVDNPIAEQSVASGQWNYCTKQEWKLAGRPRKTAICDTGKTRSGQLAS